MAAAERKIAIQADGVVKRFGHVEALTGATVRVHVGEIVALCGDNGAGKSTLLEIMCGTLAPDEGVLRSYDEPLEGTIKDFQARGIDAVHQDLALAPDLTVYESMFLGRELKSDGVLGKLGRLRRSAMRDATREALLRLEVSNLAPDARVGDLSGGQRQSLAICRGVMWTERALLLDEPTAALGAHRTEMVSSLIRSVAADGLGVLIVSHDLPRVLELADRVCVLWRGRVVVDRPAAEMTVQSLIEAMVGHGREDADVDA